jgi:hypothetical protein
MPPLIVTGLAALKTGVLLRCNMIHAEVMREMHGCMLCFSKVHNIIIFQLDNLILPARQQVVFDRVHKIFRARS